LKRIEEYDVECSMVKVWCSEMLDYVVDENVQIHGGAGFVEDYPAERFWRDARVNRIFEGTNEINRLLVPGRLIRKAMKGELPLFPKAMALMDELTAGPTAGAGEDGFLAAEARLGAGAKKVALMCLGVAVQKFQQELTEQQEILGHFADIAMETYALESAVIRTQKRAAAQGEERTRLAEAAVQAFAQEAMDRIESSARTLLAAVEEGDSLRTLLAALKRFTRRETPNTIALRRQIAEAAIEAGGYSLS
jgi:alkylation response protein AidB-like acyl-CoA dehydrogenase